MQELGGLLSNSIVCSFTVILRNRIIECESECLPNICPVFTCNPVPSYGRRCFQVYKRKLQNYRFGILRWSVWAGTVDVKLGIAGTA